MKGRLNVRFRGEEGIDAGGVSREWYQTLAREMFNPNYGLFSPTADNAFQPNRNSSINPDHLRYFRFTGMVIGKAILDGFMLDAHFTRSFYKHILGAPVTHVDMEAIDPEYYKNLKWILDNDIDGVLELTFAVEQENFGAIKTIDLKPDGRNVAVTNENKDEYVRLVTEFRMTTAIKEQLKAFLEGFYGLIDKSLISIFLPSELELLISGLPNIDIQGECEMERKRGRGGEKKSIFQLRSISFRPSKEHGISELFIGVAGYSMVLGDSFGL
jgi:E3 ubiquitin-protein ligase HUWE1